MPPSYKLRKVPKKDLYWVVSADGKHHSKEGLPKEQAKAQQRALYAAEKRGGCGECYTGGEDSVEPAMSVSAPIELATGSFDIPIREPEPYIRPLEVPQRPKATGGSIPSRHPSGWKPSAVLHLANQRALDEARDFAWFRRVTGMTQRVKGVPV